MPTNKTLGPISAKIISSLYEHRKTIFTTDDIVRFGLTSRSNAYKLVHDLAKRNIIYRLKYGKYIIIPQEMGQVNNYIGNWYVVAREIANCENYYISHYSAMDIYNMVTHPILKVYIIVSNEGRKRKKIKIIGNVTFEFISTDKKNIWGIKEQWVTNTEKVKVSAIEKTIIDCLYRPKFCGGILEVATGIWMQKENINYDKLINYVIKYDKNIVVKRLGYILESLNLQNNHYLMRLKERVNEKYYILDPCLDTNKTYKNSWKLIANISPEEIKKSGTN